MGYNTNFTIITPKEAKITEEILQEACSDYYFEEVLEGVRFVSEDSFKWYDYNDDMKKLSKKKKYKDMLFSVEGEGEDSGDIWKAYYKNGKSCHTHARIVFDDFKEEDLE